MLRLRIFIAEWRDAPCRCLSPEQKTGMATGGVLVRAHFADRAGNAFD